MELKTVFRLLWIEDILWMNNFFPSIVLSTRSFLYCQLSSQRKEWYCQCCAQGPADSPVFSEKKKQNVWIRTWCSLHVQLVSKSHKILRQICRPIKYIEWNIFVIKPRTFKKQCINQKNVFMSVIFDTFKDLKFEET